MDPSDSRPYSVGLSGNQSRELGAKKFMEVLLWMEISSEDLISTVMVI